MRSGLPLGASVAMFQWCVWQLSHMGHLLLSRNTSSNHRWPKPKEARWHVMAAGHVRHRSSNECEPAALRSWYCFCPAFYWAYIFGMLHHACIYGAYTTVRTKKAADGDFKKAHAYSNWQKYYHKSYLFKCSLVNAVTTLLAQT